MVEGGVFHRYLENFFKTSQHFSQGSPGLLQIGLQILFGIFHSFLSNFGTLSAPKFKLTDFSKKKFATFLCWKWTTNVCVKGYCNAWFTFSLRQHETRREWECGMVHLSRLAYSRPVLISSRSSQRHVGKSVPSQRKRKCLECLACLSTILARECECLHSCILRLIHISPKVSTSTRDENVNQA